MVEQASGAGGSRMLWALLGALGCLVVTIAAIAAALLVFLFVPHESMEVSLDEPVAVERGLPTGAPAERAYTMTVCADERPIRVLAPSASQAGELAFSVIPGARVGLVTAGSAPDPVALAGYGWVASDATGGIVRWWQPDDFEDFSDAELAIRNILGQCEVCCASGTVVERAEGGRTVWLQDQRFSLPDGGRVGGSFAAVLARAPAGVTVYEDEMDGLPTIDLGGVIAHSEPESDQLTMLVVQLSQP